MPKRYSRQFRKMVAELIWSRRRNHQDRRGIRGPAQDSGELGHCFDDDYISTEQQLEAARKTIRRQKETIEILKKQLPSS